MFLPQNNNNNKEDQRKLWEVMEMSCSSYYNSFHSLFSPIGYFKYFRWLLSQSAPKGFPVFNLETKHLFNHYWKKCQEEEGNVSSIPKELQGKKKKRQYSCIIMLLQKWDGENINKFISLTLLLNAENSAQINNPVLCPVAIKPYAEIVAQRMY